MRWLVGASRFGHLGTKVFGVQTIWLVDVAEASSIRRFVCRLETAPTSRRPQMSRIGPRPVKCDRPSRGIGHCTRTRGTPGPGACKLFCLAKTELGSWPNQSFDLRVSLQPAANADKQLLTADHSLVPKAHGQKRPRLSHEIGDPYPKHIRDSGEGCAARLGPAALDVAIGNARNPANLPHRSLNHEVEDVGAKKIPFIDDAAFSACGT